MKTKIVYLLEEVDYEADASMWNTEYLKDIRRCLWKKVSSYIMDPVCTSKEEAVKYLQHHNECEKPVMKKLEDECKWTVSLISKGDLLYRVRQSSTDKEFQKIRLEVTHIIKRLLVDEKES